MNDDKFEGLDVLVKEDGVYLSFESEDGNALINLSTLAEGRDKETGGVIQAWCEEARRRSEAEEARGLI